MILPLKRVITENNLDGTQVSRLPNNEEIMNKINEMVRFLNSLPKECTCHPDDGEYNPFMPK